MGATSRLHRAGRSVVNHMTKSPDRVSEERQSMADTTTSSRAPSTSGAFIDATAQAELVRRGEVSPEELVERAIARIEAVNDQLNAVIIETYDKARAEAKA